MYIEINGTPYCDSMALTHDELDEAHATHGTYPTCSGKDPQADAAAIRAIRPDLDVRVIDAGCPSYNDNSYDDRFND